jgi:hypothetical protein
VLDGLQLLNPANPLPGSLDLFALRFRLFA